MSNMEKHHYHLARVGLYRDSDLCMCWGKSPLLTHPMQLELVLHKGVSPSSFKVEFILFLGLNFQLRHPVIACPRLRLRQQFLPE